MRKNARSRHSPLPLLIKKTIRRFDLLAPGESVVVAVSGGADSVALLLCLHELAPAMHWTLTPAHLNHGLRGSESDEDEEFIRHMCGELGLSLLRERIDLRRKPGGMKRNLEEAGREARYEFLIRAMERIGADKIATGHTLNDQAETVLFRLLRGSGPGGLAGIHPKIEGRIVRPLLECSRKQILQFLSERNAAYREDSSNRDFRYRRNRIRHELIPYLEKHFNPSLIAALGREARIAGAVWEFLETLAGRECENLLVRDAGGVTMQVSGLLRIHPALRPYVVRHALEQLRGSLHGIEAAHIEAILRLAETGKSGRRIQLPGGCEASRDFKELRLLRDTEPQPPEFHYELSVPGSCRVPEAGIVIVASCPERAARPPLGGEEVLTSAHLDRDRLPATLTIRSRRPGDRYGGPGHRKVKKMLISAGIPLSKRKVIPIVAAGEAVIWIPGCKPATFFAVKPNSGRSVLLEVRLNLK